MIKAIKIIGGFIIFLFVLIGFLSSFGGSVSSELIDKQNNKLTYLQNNKEIYAKCYNSVSYPTNSRGTISLKYYIGANDELKQRIKDAENSLAKDIEEKCTQPIKDYENTYAELVDTTNEINAKSRTLLDRIIGTKPEDAENMYVDNSPQRVRLSGFNIGYYTREEIEAYFKSKLGY